MTAASLSPRPSARPEHVPAGQVILVRPDAAARARGAALSRDRLTAVQRLRLQREFNVRAALAGRTQVVVALYVLVGPDERHEAEARLAEALAVANRRSWHVALRAIDITGELDPTLRPQLARVHAALASGHIHGIVAASRIDLSPDDALYTDELNWLRSRGGFLGLARSEVAL